MPCKVLHRLWINAGVNQICDVGVAQHMRRDMKVHCINQIGVIVGMTTKNRMDFLFNFSPLI